jgi:hypothetical protein
MVLDFAEGIWNSPNLGNYLSLVKWRLYLFFVASQVFFFGYHFNWPSKPENSSVGAGPFWLERKPSSYVVKSGPN